MVETLKDYAIKAFINTVDHLGSVAHKVNEFLDEKIDDVSELEFRICCIEQVLISIYSHDLFMFLLHCNFFPYDFKL